MRARVFILALAILMLVPSFVNAQACDPPATGNWKVNETVSCSGKTIVLNGSLLVNGSGNLTIESSTVQFNSTSDGQYGIEVNGSLYVRNSRVESNTTKAYTFVINAGAYIEVKDSEIRKCGYSSGNIKNRGLYVNADGFEITNTTFSGNYFAMIIGSQNGKVRFSRIKSNTAGLEVTGSGNALEHNIIQNNTGKGIYVTGDGLNITNNTVLENEYGIYLNGTTGISISNSLCNKSSSYDIFMLSAGNTVISGTNYTSLVKKWYLDVEVMDEEGEGVEEADVVIKNNFTQAVFSGETDSYGGLAEQVLNERVENESGTFVFNPYSINVTEAGYYDNFTEFNLTGDMYLEIILNSTPEENATALVLTINSPLNKTYFGTDPAIADDTLELTVSSETNMTSCDYSLDNGTRMEMDEVSPNRFQSSLDVLDLEGHYKLTFFCESSGGRTNSTSVFLSLYPFYECRSSFDCESTEICTDSECVELDCECGYAVNHECILYECCEDDDCKDNEYCDPDDHSCELVICDCPEKRYDHECHMVPEYCCSDLQCNENETCIENECVKKTLSFYLPEKLVLGETIKILVLNQDGDPVSNVGIDVKYPDRDPPVTESYYTDSNGVAEIPIKYAGRVDFVARKAKYFTSYRSGEVEEPFNWMFVIQAVVLVACIAGIAVIGLKFLRGGFPGRSSFRLEKNISGNHVMLRIRNNTNDKLQNITIRDSVPEGAFIRCNINPEIEQAGNKTEMLEWFILELGPKEEIIIEYEAAQTGKGFTVEFHGREYNG